MENPADDEAVRAFLAALDAAGSRSKLAPHYRAIETILAAGHPFTVAHRYVTQVHGLKVGYSTLWEYVQRRRRQPAGATPQITPAAPGPARQHPPVGTPAAPALQGTSSWFVIDDARRNAQKHFEELGAVARQRRRQEREKQRQAQLQGHTPPKP